MLGGPIPEIKDIRSEGASEVSSRIDPVDVEIPRE
jgi:hypothetical protein